jgi:pilus assembly protein FimV
MPLYGLAAGLGKLSVNSGLGEPLKAEIDLLSVTPDELSSLSAVIASEEAYALQGIPRLGVHSNIKVELAKNPDGSPVLRLRSQQPIDDPYLDMLIQVDWASGRLLREYTILLDPPGYKQSLSEEPVTSVINKPGAALSGSTSTQSGAYAATASQPVSGKAKSSKKSTAKNTKSSESNESSAEVATAYELTTQRGDTLNAIAKEVQVEGISLDQMLVGLFEANKNAFVDGNMNRLKVGQIVKIPSKDALSAVSPTQAAKEVKVHSANWNAYRNNLAGNVMAAPVTEETERKQSASGKIASAEDKAAPVKSGPQDVVKLSAGGKAATQGGKASAEADAKVLALQEEATAREKSLKEAHERTTALESQIADMQKLLALKSQTMADVQKNADAASKPAEQQAPAVPAQAVPVPEATPVAPETASAAQPAASPAAEPVKQEVPAADVKTPVAVKAPVQAPPEEEPSFLASLLESVNLFMLGGAGGVALLGAGWVYLRNKRRKDLDSFERGILTSGGLRANTVFGNTTGSATSSADTSFLTDFAQSADGGMIDTNDVDPIAEAEVYMAYGRDAQAEEILKDAISKEPKRYELHLKLLEMYAARKDASAFETIAGELYTTLGSDDPTWAKVAELGVTVEPDNPLYDISQLAPSAPAAKPVESNAVSAVADTGLGNDLDFSFDQPESGSEAKPSLDALSAASGQAESFDLGGLSGSTIANDVIAADAVESAATADSKASAGNSMDFDFPDFGTFASEAEASAAVNDEPSLAAISQQEAEFAAAPAADDSSSAAGLDFNFTQAQAVETPEVTVESSDFNFEGFADAVTPAEEEKIESSALDSIDFNFEGFSEPAAEVSALEGINLNFEADAASDMATADDKPEEISFDFPLVDDQESSGLNQNEANNFDFSAISLDLSGAEPVVIEAPAPAAVPELIAEAPLAVADENPDIDIKLDLVKVYIDMEDIEGARDLLDEVLKEGGPQQRLTAEKLLASLA